MLRSIGARVGAAIALGAIAVSALAAPVSAASHTRWVDNDSKKGDGPVACDTAHFHSIQAAIDASSPGDEVFVCPGSYSEQVIIDTPNLLVQSRPTRSATIVPPEAVDLQLIEGGYDLVDILANDVSFVGFRMNIPSGDLQVNGASALPETCINLDTVVYIDATGVNVKANSMKAVGDFSLSGECGYDVGIGIVNGPFVASKTQAVSPYGSDTSDISRNRIVDFKFAGVIAEGLESVRIYHNAIRYIHANDPATCVLTPVLGFTESLTFPCLPPTSVQPKQSNGIFTGTAGVLVEGALADLRGNSIYSTYDISVCVFPEDICPAFLSSGIVMIGDAPGSIVRNNRTNNVGIGISMGLGGPVEAKTSALPEAPNGTQVTGNRTNESFIGIGVGESNGVYYGNRAHLNFGGAIVEAGGNVFDSNDFRFNYEGDCIDQTSGTGTQNTDNNWDAVNYGSNNEPADICLDIGPF